MNRTIFSLLCVLIFSAGTFAADKQTRVACVGDSITHGSGTKDIKTDAYPAQLGKLLGDQWVVENFGVGGATLLNHGNKPYQKQKDFKAALDSKPDVVVIMLGTNDSKPQNWKFKDEFVADRRGGDPGQDRCGGVERVARQTIVHGPSKTNARLLMQ